MKKKTHRDFLLGTSDTQCLFLGRFPYDLIPFLIFVLFLVVSQYYGGVVSEPKTSHCPGKYSTLRYSPSPASFLSYQDSGPVEAMQIKNISTSSLYNCFLKFKQGFLILVRMWVLHLDIGSVLHV